MEHLLLLFEILIINLVLSGDNAVVIAMASKHLPPQQRRQAVWWGSFGAVLMRCILTWLAAILLKIPFIQAAGGVMLAMIAFNLLQHRQHTTEKRQADTIWKAIQTILVADFIMSLDNVLAIAALADGDVAILVIGIAVSIPIVIWGSNLISVWLQRLPILTFAGAGILGYTAGDMMLKDARLGIFLTEMLPSMHTWIPLIMAVVVIIFGWLGNGRAA
ncbi:TerC family protein [Paenibacillus lentus]|uniref:TerC family protein n=1 Tax=Paenibacillus lentus TaxID=1338368 RepID=A0A3Q8S4X4_9BACL|nr:TerC family protein [Paenibacillus lentus]AZK46859.1 TerC family protein [Paenibacillus lentus]